MFLPDIFPRSALTLIRPDDILAADMHPTQSSPQPTSFFSAHRQAFLWLGLILLVVFLAFSPTLKNDFVNWDDDEHLFRNASVLSLSSDGIEAAFHGTVNKTYIPLTTLSFAVEHHFIGFRPFLYHLDNLLLHLFVTMLVFALGLRMGLVCPASAMAALLFGIHPMHVESVAWVTERKDVLYSLFYLLALHGYWTYLERKSYPAYGLSLICGLLSLLAKPMALSLPLILFLMDRFRGRTLDGKSFIDKIPFLIYVIPIAWITYSLNARVPDIHLLKSTLIWMWSFVFHIEKFIAPFHLIPVYSVPSPVTLANPVYLVSTGIFFLVCAGVWAGRRNPWVLMAFGYYFLSIFFLLRFDVYDPTPVADRFMYLPSLGLCFLFGYSVHCIWEKGRHAKLSRWGVVIILTGVFGCLSIGTFRQTQVWANSFTLWNHVLKYSPDNNTAYYCRGEAYMREKKYNQALDDMIHGLRILPNKEAEYFNRGVLFEQMGQPDFALKDYAEAIKINPKSVRAYNNQAAIYFDRKEYQEAITALNLAMAADPKAADTFLNRGIVYEQLNDLDQALKDYDAALQRDPYFREAYENRSRVWSEKQEWAKALADVRKARSLGVPIAQEDILNLQRRLKPF